MVRLVVGEWLDVAAVRGEDDQSLAMAVIEQLQELLAPPRLLLGGGRIDRNTVQASAELAFLFAIEPSASTATHADGVGRGFRLGVGERVEGEGVDIAPDDRLPADVQADGPQQVGEGRRVLGVFAQVILVRSRQPHRDSDLTHGRSKGDGVDGDEGRPARGDTDDPPIGPTRAEPRAGDGVHRSPG